ncbi:MAG: hypothetical protein ACLFM1_01395 [Bacteroidales bacterium]
MKRIMLILLMLVFLIGSASAQKIKVEEDEKKINGSKRDVLLVEIPQTDQKTVEKAWKKRMKDHDAESFKSKKEMFADNVLIESVTDNTIDIYARAEENNEYVEFYVAVDLGGAYMDSEHDSEQTAMKRFIENFASGIALEAYQEMLDDQKGILKDLNKEIKSLANDKEHYEKKIEKYQDKIEDHEADIKDVEKEMEKQQELLEDEEKKLKEMEEKSIKN